ncbi:DMT family transporter [Salisediminibacterium selenitireducens]|uniref:EamA domain-containing protein n=1 Tax=Bacillus selenitireducens (strain ATCC 700615 / DSM 15326 / MLS10) TaxID=439292 RepID=D6XX66_BACIE|nr:DMT family transporter [Salisediminibacterium selenitireducens]ADH97923.1 protein of unknown function DUF6 transmembrane [[Bacillus] selenitireducens MLS10]
MALFLGLITAMAFGIGDFLAGQVTRRVPTLIVVLYAQLFGTVMMLIVASLTGFHMSLSSFWWGGLGGIAIGFGFLFYFKALAMGKMGVVSSVTGTLSAVVPVLTGLFLGERPGTFALVAVGIIMIAIVLISKKEVEGDAEDGDGQKVLSFAAMAGFLIGLYFVFLHIPPETESMWTVFFTMAGSFLAVSSVLLFRRADFLTLNRTGLGYIFGNGFLQAFGTITYILGVSIGLLSIVALAGALSPLFTVLCAWLFIKEMLTVPQKWGITLALTGVVLLVLST